jgi:hypothetical protein
MLAKNETGSTSSATSAINAPVRSRSKIIAAAQSAKSAQSPSLFSAPVMPVRNVAAAPVETAPAKPRMSFAEFQQMNATASVQEVVAAAPAAAAPEVVSDLLGGMSEADLIRKLAAYDDLKMRAKKLYEEADALEAEIFEVMRPGDIVKMADGRKATMVDNLDGFDKRTGKPKNKIWKIAGASRFELEFTKAGK